MQLCGRQDDGGEETLPLLLLPGTLCDARVFGPLQERLPAIKSQVLLTTKAHSMAEAAEQVLAQAPERFALLGFSLGGMVAMETALLAPERVCGLALVSTTPLPVPAERQAVRRARVQDARVKPIAEFVRERLWPEYDVTSEHDSLMPLFQAMAESLGHETFALQTEMALERKDYRLRLAALACPVLVLAGRNDTLCPPAAQEQLTGAFIGSTCVMLPGAGHLALLERPDEVAAAVAAWFHEVQRTADRDNLQARPRCDL